MADRRVELLLEEDAAWQELHDLLHRVNDELFERPGLTDEGWSIKDVAWHIACWCAYAADALEQIRQGTYEDAPLDVEALNREWFEVSRTLDPRTVHAELAATRTKMLAEWHAVRELTPMAIEWFEESGHLHYREHTPDIVSFFEASTGGRSAG
jgi:hypothetical protein